MKVLVFSNTHMADCDIPLVSALQKNGVDAYYMIEMDATGASGTIIDVPVGKKANAIIPAAEYKELEVFSKCLDLSKVFIKNHYRKHNIPLMYELILTIKTFAFILSHKFDVIQRTQVYFRTDILLYIFRKKTIKMVHDPFPHTGDSFSGQTKFFYDLGLKLIPRFVILNTNQYDDFCKVYHKNPKNVLLTRLGAYETYNLFLDEKSNCNMHKNILFFGRISKYKGIEYLCEAMKKVHAELPDATLTIAGSGDFYFDIKPYDNLEYFDIQNRFISAVELTRLVSNCDVVVCPYIDATQSGVVMTAYSMNKPVVATNVGGLSEQVVDGKSGIIVEPKDAYQLSKALIMLLNNQKTRESMNLYIESNRISGKLSWNNIAQLYINFYKTIC